MSQKQRPKCCRTGEYAADGRPLCGHGEPMYLFGGCWRCAVRVRERVTDRYHGDIHYRVPYQLQKNARARAQRLEASKRRLHEGG